MSYATAKIIADQKRKQNDALPLDNELSAVYNMVKDAVTSSSNNDDNIKEVEASTLPSSNDYDTILNEIQTHEQLMETAVKNADEISDALKQSIMYYLNIRSANRNGILFRGVPEVLQASARLLDISISGRYKIANMKRMRASIIKDKMGKSDNSNELNLAVLLANDN